MVRHAELSSGEGPDDARRGFHGSKIPTVGATDVSVSGCWAKKVSTLHSADLHALCCASSSSVGARVRCRWCPRRCPSWGRAPPGPVELGAPVHLAHSLEVKVLADRVDEVRVQEVGTRFCGGRMYEPTSTDSGRSTERVPVARPGRCQCSGSTKRQPRTAWPEIGRGSAVRRY